MNNKKTRRRRRRQHEISTTIRKKITGSNEYKNSEIEINELLDEKFQQSEEKKQSDDKNKEIEFFFQLKEEQSSVKTASTTQHSDESKTHLASSYIQIEDYPVIERNSCEKFKPNSDLFCFPSCDDRQERLQKNLNIRKDLKDLGLSVNDVNISKNDSNYDRMQNRLATDDTSNVFQKFYLNKQNYELYKTTCLKEFEPIFFMASLSEVVGRNAPNITSGKNYTIYMKDVKFTQHPLFSEEHRLANYLEDIYRVYEKQKDDNLVEKISTQLIAIRNIVERFLGNSEIDELQQDFQNYVEKIQKHRLRLHKEERLQRETVTEILKIWKSLKEIREKQKFNYTTHKVRIRKLEKNVEIEESNWNERFEIELSECVREAYQDYYTEKRLRKSTRNDKRIESQPPLRKPDIEEIRHQLRNNFRENVPDPSEPEIILEMVKESEGSSINVANTKKYYLKLFFDREFMVSTKPSKPNSEFIVKFNIAYTVAFKKFHPKLIKIEIFEKSLRLPPDIKIASIEFPFRKNPFSEIESLSFSSDKYSISGLLNISLGKMSENSLESSETDSNLNLNSTNFQLPKETLKTWYENDLIDPLDPDSFSICEQFLYNSNRENVHTVNSADTNSSKVLEFNEDLYSFCSDNEIKHDLRLNMLTARYKCSMEHKDLQLIPAFQRELNQKSDDKVIETASDEWMGQIDLQKYKGKKYLQQLYETISKYCSQLNRNKETKNLLMNQPTFSSILSAVIEFFSPKRPLNPPKKLTTLKLPLQAKKQQNFNIIVNLIRATGVPIRETSTSTRRNSSVSMLQQGYKCANIRPYISVSYRDKTARTVSVDGSNPTWNEQLMLPISGIISDLKGDVKFQLFDEFVEDLSSDDRSHATEVYQRIYGKWLGELRIPINTILLRQQIDGIFEITIPQIILGYTKPTLVPTDQRISIEQVPEIRDNVYLSIYINVEPQFDIENIITKHMECSELCEVTTHIQKWCQQYREMFPERFVNPLICMENGKRVCITRILEGIPIPFEVNDYSDRYCRRFVSLIPTVQNTINNCSGLGGIWLSNQIILNTSWASPKDLGVLLACFFLTLGIRVSLVLGTSATHGEIIFVLLKESFSLLLIDPTNGKKYSTKDTLCPLTKIYCIVSQNNIYANIQQETRPTMTDFDYENTRNWLPLFNKNNPAPLAGVHDLSYSYSSNFPVLDLRKNIERKIMKKINSWRSNRKTIWNRSLQDLLTVTIKDLEEDLIFERNLNIHLERITEALPAFRISGFTLNFPYTNLSAISERIKSTGVHMNSDKKIEFSLAVYIHEYPGNILSIWIFIMSMTPYL